MSTITGLHHVTVIAGDAQRNLDFYTRVMGMRLVKRTVNQDLPDTYHLFYGDGVGHAGSDLTFFPWPKMPPGTRGIGLTNEVSLAVPAGSLDFWAARFDEHGVSTTGREMRFGERALPFTDPHDLALTLTETSDARDFTPWGASPVPAEHQVRGLHAVRLAERELETTTHFLTEGLGFVLVAEEGSWRRYAIAGGGSGRVLDIQEVADGRRGSWGVGAVHHVAWRVPDDETQSAVRERVVAAGAHATAVIDRFWFRSVYFKEPGGALFEVATDGPGFAVDERIEALGERLILPPWLEEGRAGIEDALPPLVQH
ncbi:MAG TPA: ring-cleaving dioxygenase [Gemmatimonadaceae bacterium]|jgi:glyoxalase family protein|nr:ring-cleaving dioxygenase [Gemmatimonadaceae bacterium]